MPRIAIQLTPDFVAAIQQMLGLEEDVTLFGDSAYAVVEPVSPTEFTLKLMNDDAIFEAVKTDSDLTILSL